MSTCFAIVDDARARVFSDRSVDEIELLNVRNAHHVFARTIVGELMRTVELERVARLVIGGTARMLAELRDVSHGHDGEDLIVDEVERDFGCLSRSQILEQLGPR